MLQVSLLLVLAAARAAVLHNALDISSLAPVCHRSDPALDSCLRTSLETALHKIAKKGLKELGMPPLEPLRVPEMIGSFKGAGYDFNSLAKDSAMEGFGKIKITDFRAALTDPRDLRLEMDYYVPEVRGSGRFRLEGVIATVPVNGKGPFSFNLTDLRATLKLFGHLEERDGAEFLEVDKIHLTPTIENLKMNWENIVDGNKQLSSAANNFFNSFWKPIFEAVMPFLQNSSDKLFRYYIEKVTKKVPFDQLIPM